MREITVNPELVAACGLYCGACRQYLQEKCPGCRANAKATWCKTRSCNLAAEQKTCAECKQYSDPMLCKKYNNVMTKFFSFVFRSNRAACIAQIRSIGLEGHARRMAELKSQTLKR